MRKYLFLLVILSANLFGFAQTSSQTRTAAYLNNLNNFQDVIGDGNYTTATTLNGVINN